MWVYDVPGLCPTIDQNFKFSLKKGFALRWNLCFHFYDHHHIHPHKLCQLLSRDQSRRGNMSSYSICSWRLAGRTAARFNIIKILMMRSVMMIMMNNMRMRIMLWWWIICEGVSRGAKFPNKARGEGGHCSSYKSQRKSENSFWVGLSPGRESVFSRNDSSLKLLLNNFLQVMVVVQEPYHNEIVGNKLRWVLHLAQTDFFR